MNTQQHILNKRYTIMQVLGQGGMGKVYLAFDLELKQHVAVKECFIPKNSPHSLVERIHREYEYMNKINHLNLVKAMDFFSLGNRYFIVMEYVTGCSLQRFIIDYSYSISIEKQIHIATQICDAVATLNENNIIHRDIKPANIIISNNEVPKLLDLGIAKNIDDEQTALTGTNTVIGTAKYMSPEQIENKVFANTDVFLLGIVLYQFFSWAKDSPFDGGSIVSTMNKVHNCDLPPLFSESTNYTHQGIASIVSQSLDKNHISRTGSAREMCIAFDKLKISQEKSSGADAPNRKRSKRIRNEKTTGITGYKNNHCLYFTIMSFFILLLIFILLWATGTKKFQKNNPKLEQKILLKELLSKAKEAYLNKNYQAANYYCDYVLEKDTGCVDAYFYKGRSLEKLKNYDLAEENYTLAITFEPNYIDAYIQRAYLYHSRNEYELAEKDYNKIEEINPHIALTYNNRGILYKNQGKYDLAEKDFNKAIELSFDYSYYGNRGNLYTAMKKYDLAIKDHTKSIELAPKGYDSHGPYYNRGNVYKEINCYDLAEKDYNKAIGFNPKHIDSYYDRGYIYSQQKRYDLAEKDYTQVIELDPKHVNSYNNRAFIYMEQQHYDLAEKDYNKALYYQSNDAMLYGNRGILYQRQQRYDLAEKDYNKALELNPRYSDIYNNKGNLYFLQENYNLAIQNWKIANEMGVIAESKEQVNNKIKVAQEKMNKNK